MRKYHFSLFLLEKKNLPLCMNDILASFFFIVGLDKKKVSEFLLHEV